MDMHDEANNHISKFCKRAKKFFILQSAFLCVVCTSKSTAIIFRVRQLTGLWRVRKIATITLVMSVRLSAHVEYLGSHSTDFHDIWYLSIFQNSVEKIHVSLKSDKNNGYFTWRPVYIYENIVLSSS